MGDQGPEGAVATYMGGQMDRNHINPYRTNVENRVSS